jgi:hypothetical protein
MWVHRNPPACPFVAAIAHTYRAATSRSTPPSDRESTSSSGGRAALEARVFPAPPGEAA